MSTKIKITFVSGAGTVTGANFLVEGGGKKFLIDCGLVQSEKLADDYNWSPFPYDPKEIDALFVTHAHVDHVGRIPKLIYDGFKGKIISSIPTKELAEVMIDDTNSILGHDRDHGLDKIYTESTLKRIMSFWEVRDYHEAFTFGDFSIVLKDAGHILGSAMFEFSIAGKKIVFTGDLGNSPSPLLRDTESITDANYMIMESVYGDRNHEDRNERRKLLETYIEDNYKRKGTLMIPTFSLERTQELLYEINDLVNEKRVPVMPIFLDSPLAIRLTSIYQKYFRYYNKDVAVHLAKGDDIFTFPGLRLTLETKESKDIYHSPNPKIIIAGSGMSNGGRIVHHEQHFLPDPNNTILLTGYQSMSTLGRKIEDGQKKIKIFGENVDVRAHVVKISGYSGHKDSDHLIDFVQDTTETLEKVFVVMGEPKSSMFLAQRLRDGLAIDAVVPLANDSAVLEW